MVSLNKKNTINKGEKIFLIEYKYIYTFDKNKF